MGKRRNINIILIALCIILLSTCFATYHSWVRSTGQHARVVQVQPRDDANISVGIPQPSITDNQINSESVPEYEETTLTDLEEYVMSVTKVLKFEEGFRSKPYLCSEGYVTIGLGTKLHNDLGLDPIDFPLRIDLSTAEGLLSTDVATIYNRLNHPTYVYINSVFKKLSLSRREILISMMYQMGVSGVAGFKKMWLALEDGKYEEATVEMMDSRWARQTPARARRHAIVMESDSFEVYNNYFKD